jgi:hypothetical protein
VFTNPGGVVLPPVRRPTLSLALDRRRGVCVSKSFVARVRATGDRVRTVVRRDKRVLTSTRNKTFKVRIGVRKLKAGRHTVRAVATDRFGRRAIRSRAFERCAPS